MELVVVGLDDAAAAVDELCFSADEVGKQADEIDTASVCDECEDEGDDDDATAAAADDGFSGTDKTITADKAGAE